MELGVFKIRNVSARDAAPGRWKRTRAPCHHAIKSCEALSFSGSFQIKVTAGLFGLCNWREKNYPAWVRTLTHGVPLTWRRPPQKWAPFIQITLAFITYSHFNGKVWILQHSVSLPAQCKHHEYFKAQHNRTLPLRKSTFNNFLNT